MCREQGIEPVNETEYEYTLAETAELASRGDVKMLHVLCQRIAKAVLFHTMRVLGNREDAEDVSQEVLLRVCEKIGDLREPSTFPRWLGRIVTNEANRFLSRSQKRGTVLNIDDYLSKITEENARLIPHESAENEELREFVVQTIDNMNVRQKEAALLHYYIGLNVSETARTMGITKGSASKLLALAREKLRRELEYRHPVYGGKSGPCDMGAVIAIPLIRNNPAPSKAIRTLKRFSLTLLKPVAASLAAVIATCGVALGIVMNRSQPQSQAAAPLNVSSNILFTGGTSPAEGAAHINPAGARAFAESENGQLTPIEWAIVSINNETGFARGTGGVVENIGQLDLADGEYLLVFRMRDTSGMVGRLGKNFIIKNAEY